MTTSKTPSNATFASRWLTGWLPFWACSYTVFQSAVLPPKEIPHILLEINDKVIHASEYFILALAAVHAFRKAKTPFFRSYAWPSTLFYGAAMGALTEFAQLKVPGRSCDILDWAADFTGTALALVLAAMVTRRAENR